MGTQQGIMAFLGTTLLSGMSLSSAEKAFRPWWDTVEDHIVYTIVILGIIIAPTSLVLGTTIDCTFCKNDHCGAYINTKDDPSLNLLFIKRYCSLEGPLSPIILYFPYILLIIGTVLVMIDRPFVMILFKSYNMEEMFNLLVVDDPNSATYDAHKEVRELKNVMSSNGSNYFKSYLLRTTVSLIVSSFPIVIFVYYWHVFDSGVLYCYVHERYWYECSGHPVQFYMIVMAIVEVLLALYFLLNMYNLAWVLLPGFSKLRSIMNVYKKTLKSHGELEQFYYNNRDVQLLLNLLGCSSGVSGPMRSLALIDKDFCYACLPQLESCLTSPSETSKMVARISIKKESLLYHLNKKTSMRLSFITEEDGGGSVPFFLQSDASYEAVLNTDSSLTKSLMVKTLVDGKIIASEKLSIPSISELTSTLGENNNE